MKFLTVFAIAALLVLVGCKKEVVEETDVVETGSQETGALDTDPVTDTDPAQ